MTKGEKLEELGYINIHDGLVFIKEDSDYFYSITLKCEGYFKEMIAIYIKDKNVSNHDVLSEKDINKLKGTLSSIEITKLEKAFKQLKSDYEKINKYEG